MYNMQQIMQMLASGGNPGMMMQEIAKTNPLMQRAMEMGQGKTPQELAAIARNLAAQQGIGPEQFNSLMKQFGLQP